jgi:hypothetical protein
MSNSADSATPARTPPQASAPPLRPDVDLMDNAEGDRTALRAAKAIGQAWIKEGQETAR